MKASLETADGSEVQGQEVKEQSAVGFGCQAYELALSLRGRRVINILEVCGFTTQSRAVINNLAVYFARCVIDEGQGSYPLSAPVRKSPGRSLARTGAN